MEPSFMSRKEGMKTADEIDVLLKQPKVQRRLQELHRRIGTVQPLGETAWAEGEKLRHFKGHPHDRRHVTQCLREIIFDDLAPLPQVTPRDVTPLFIESFINEHDFSFEDSAEFWMESIRCLPTFSYRSDPIIVGVGDFVGLVGEGQSIGKLDVPLLTTDSNFRVAIVACLPASYGLDDFSRLAHRVLAQVEGFCTRDAFDAAMGEISCAVTALVRNVHLLYQAQKSEAILSKSASMEEMINAIASQERAVIAEGNSLGTDFSFVPDTLAAYFAKAPRKDSILRRIRNATRLLVQADMQAETAVGLALSVAATEALLCRKGTDICNLFAENVAALLEPDPHYRDAAFAWAKRLYGLRPDVLHGSGLECAQQDIDNARLLAAAVQKAMVELRQFFHKMSGECETPDELLRELRADKYTPGQLTGVEESPIVTCWRPQSGEK